MTDQIAPDQNQEMVIRKCRCDSVWCPQCFKQRKVPKLYSRLDHRLDWKSTRHIVLTIDRNRFESGEIAYLYVNAKKKIPQLIHNLKRTHGIQVRDYVWILEWHRDGYPHWHVFVDVTKTGSRGMIKFDKIQHYWFIGNVAESYFKTEKHWNRLVGYFGKHGYFEKSKAHQAKLPAWAENYNRTIKRTGSASIQCHLKTENEKQREKEKLAMRKKLKEIHKGSNEKFFREQGMYPTEQETEPEKKERKPYHVLFEACGKTCTITMLNKGQPYMGFMINMPYWEMRKLFNQGEMREGFGYVVDMDQLELRSFLSQFLPKFAA